MVLRVSTTTAPVPATACAKRRAWVATPERWLEQVEHGPLGGEDATGRSLDGGQDVPVLDVRSLGHHGR